MNNIIEVDRITEAGYKKNYCLSNYLSAINPQIIAPINPLDKTFLANKQFDIISILALQNSWKMSTKIFVLWMIFQSLLSISFSQKGPDHNFIDSQLIAYKRWMQFTHLSTILKVDTITNNEEKVILKMSVKNLSTWKVLIFHVDSAFNSALSDALLYRLAFQMDTAIEKCEIKIVAQDATIFINSNDGNTSTNVWKKMGELIDSTVSVIPEINDLDELNIESSREISDIRNRLESGLSEYFKKYKTHLGNVQIQPIYELNDKLVLEISNLKNAILDEGYFEFVTFYFRFYQKEKKVEVAYKIYGKYAAGILWTPRNSRYHDITPEYNDEFARFKIIMSNEIGKLIQ